MKEINKLIILIVMIMLNFFSCKTASTVSFESNLFEGYSDKEKFSDSFTDVKYCTRIGTAFWLELIFHRFSRIEDSPNLKIYNLYIFDDTGKEIFSKESIEIIPVSGELKQKSDKYFLELYCYKISEEKLSRLYLKNYKTKYLILKYKIDGVEYVEKLIRNETKSLVLRT